MGRDNGVAEFVESLYDMEPRICISASWGSVSLWKACEGIPFELGLRIVVGNVVLDGEVHENARVCLSSDTGSGSTDWNASSMGT